MRLHPKSARSNETIHSIHWNTFGVVSVPVCVLANQSNLLTMSVIASCTCDASSSPSSVSGSLKTSISITTLRAIRLAHMHSFCFIRTNARSRKAPTRASHSANLTSSRLTSEKSVCWRFRNFSQTVWANRFRSAAAVVSSFGSAVAVAIAVVVDSGSVIVAGVVCLRNNRPKAGRNTSFTNDSMHTLESVSLSNSLIPLISTNAFASKIATRSIHHASVHPSRALQTSSPNSSAHMAFPMVRNTVFLCSIAQTPMPSATSVFPNSSIARRRNPRVASRAPTSAAEFAASNIEYNVAQYARHLVPLVQHGSNPKSFRRSRVDGIHMGSLHAGPDVIMCSANVKMLAV